MIKIHKWTIYLKKSFPFVRAFENNYSLNREIKKAIKAVKR